MGGEGGASAGGGGVIAPRGESQARAGRAVAGLAEVARECPCATVARELGGALVGGEGAIAKGGSVLGEDGRVSFERLKLSDLLAIADPVGAEGGRFGPVMAGGQVEGDGSSGQVGGLGAGDDVEGCWRGEGHIGDPEVGQRGV